jgi:hypothetical protein
MKDFGLLASVVEHKKVFFREAAARYDLAKPGNLLLRRQGAAGSAHPTLRRFEATTGTRGRCSLLKLHGSIP